MEDGSLGVYLFLVFAQDIYILALDVISVGVILLEGSELLR